MIAGRLVVPEAGDVVGGEVGAIVVGYIMNDRIIAERYVRQRHCVERPTFFQKTILPVGNEIA